MRPNIDRPSRPFSGAPDDIGDRLAALPGVVGVQALETTLARTRVYALELEQPEDHERPDGPRFRQRLVLHHRDSDAPLVMHHSGYGLFGGIELWANYATEPAVGLEANEVHIEHRFYGTSIAETPDWSNLTVEASARDSHRILETLGQIYPGPRVGTGVSKGGMSAALHHRYFPQDLEAVVAYVAPISYDPKDGRYESFLARIGPADGGCRDRVLDMAVELVERRTELAATGAFAETDLARGEAAVVEAARLWHWEFWQYLGEPEVCRRLVPRGAPASDLAAYLPRLRLDPFRLDPDLWPYYYQVEYELGAPAVRYPHLQQALDGIDVEAIESLYDPFPWPADPTFDPVPMREFDTFLQNEAEHVLAVYGAWDPWTAGALPLDPDNDNLFRIVPEFHHGAQLFMLDDAERESAIETLVAWVFGSTDGKTRRGPTKGRLLARQPSPGFEAFDQARTRLERAIVRRAGPGGP